MKDHQRRVVEELEDLDGKLARLDGFLADTPSGIALDPAERADMQQQADTMSTYRRILARRIARF